MFAKLDDKVSVSPQLAAGDVARAAAEGYRLIVNNRPDGEASDQPPAAEIEAAARRAGIGYCHVPVAGGFSHADVDAVRAALDAAAGRTLMFCRSGSRSALLWGLAEAKAGRDPEALAARAAAAGYDLSPIRDAMRALGGGF